MQINLGVFKCFKTVLYRIRINCHLKTMADETNADVNYRSICCDQIPDLFFDKLVAKKYFSKFGKISRFILRPKRLSCTVEYETEEEAERAMEEGGNYNGYEFPIRYAEREIGHVQNTEEWVDADVQAELDAMSGRKQINAAIPIPANKKTMAPISKINSWTKVTQKSNDKDKVYTTQASTKIDPVLRLELETMLRQPAPTNEEKYRVLDARDKLIRLLSVKQTDISKAESRRGTCPDMCPEKERLMRDFQRQVSVFEMNKSSLLSTISHHRAIKEYSRSSADQVVPLPHELRPERVLKMTMLYLMHNIMDQLESTNVSVSDWFHFLWDRTRSIRKDITQQELCSLEAVELVEQCARFHIHCGARLVAEDPSVFDNKINAENLTKCLQTLKYLYHDLRLKSVLCPREAEFRGYIVLLNLGNSNFLWEVKQLPEHIQKSKEIKRAMEFYNVLQNNNYVRFFNMVRDSETSYLSACILLNYFTKLRYHAMEAIVKSHNWRKSSLFLPLKYLTRILGFEDDNAAVHFFGYHGLECSQQRGVLLEKLTPSTGYSMDRALKLVESKRKVSVGECVFGHPLDSREIFENHTPHNSFDENGILKLEAWTADDQLRGKAAIERAKERKILQNQTMAQAQQQQTTTTTLPPVVQLQFYTPPKIQEDNAVFKIPQVSTQFTLKQQPQPQQTTQKPNVGFSLFGNKTANFFAPKTQTTDSIFKKPEFIDYSIKPGSTGGNLFATVVTTSATNSSGNIFGSAQTQTSTSNNLFGKSLEANITSIPRDNNVFQYFQTSINDFDTPKQIFAAITKNTQADLEQEIERQKAEIQLEELEKQKLEADKKLQLQLDLEQEARMQKLANEEQLKRINEAAKVAKATEFRKQLEELQRRAVNETDLFINNAIANEIAKVAKNELCLYQNFAKKSAQIAEQIIDETIAEEVTNIANTEYSIICHDRMLLERYFTLWLKATRKKILQRHLLQTMPMWVSAETREEITEQFYHPTMSLNMKLIKRYRHGESCNFRKILSEDDAEDLRWRQSIDICNIIAKHMSELYAINKIQHCTYFKMLFTLPAENEELYGFESLCNKWLQMVLRFPDVKCSNALDDKDDDNDDETTTSASAYLQTLQENVALCVRKVSGTPAINEKGARANNAECDHIDCLVFFMTCYDLKQTRRRLQHLLQNSKNFKKLPITFLVYADSDVYNEKELIHALDLKFLMEQKKLTSFSFYYFKARKALQRFKLILETALNCVISKSLKLNSPIENSYEMRSTQNWLETCLGEEMWLRWHTTKLQNPVFSKLCNNLPKVIELYHASIEYIANIILQDFSQAPEFPIELRSYIPKYEYNNINLLLGLPHFPIDWKSKERKEMLLEFLKSIKLPNIKNSPPPIDDIKNLKLWLNDFASLCIPNNDEKASAAAYYAIKALIDELKNVRIQHLEISERMREINFLPVVKVLVFAHISEQLSKATLPTVVIYKEKDLKNYLEAPWWLNCKAIESITNDYESSKAQQKFEFEAEISKDTEVVVKAALEKATNILNNPKEKCGKENRNEIANKNENTIDELFRQLYEKMHDFETAKNFGVYDLNISLGSSTKLARSKCRKRTQAYDDGNFEKAKQHKTCLSEADEVIAKAQTFIDSD